MCSNARSPSGYPADPGPETAPGPQRIWWSAAASLPVQASELFFVGPDVDGDGFEGIAKLVDLDGSRPVSVGASRACWRCSSMSPRGVPGRR